MVEVTIEITQWCEHDCPWCSSNASSDGKHLELHQITDFLQDQSDIERINISGGEPLAHPDFYKILQYCYQITDNVWIYTNAIHQIMYNTHILKEIKIEANTVLAPGEPCYVSKNVKTHLLKPIPQGRAKNMKMPEIVVSRNFYDPSACDECNHILLQADGKTVKAPCVKEYSP